MLVSGFLLLVVALAIARAFDRSTVIDGPAGSSFVTTSQGTAALFEVLSRLGGDPARLQSPIAYEDLEAADTYAVLDPGLTGYGDPEVKELSRFAEGGGTVVIAGLPPEALASALVEDVPEWSATRSAAEAHAELPGIGRVRAGRFGLFVDPGSGKPLLTAENGLLAVRDEVGSGEVVFVADVAVFSNQNLDQLDNAELGVAIMGMGTVLFDEYRHGYTEGGPTGLVTSLPGRWNTVAALLLAVTVGGLVTYGRRLGPPEPVRRDIAPPRRSFLESVGRTLRRTHDPVGATAPTRHAVKERVATRASLPVDAGDDDLRAAARAVGLAEDEIEAVFRPRPDTVLTADRALARLSRTPADEERA